MKTTEQTLLEIYKIGTKEVKDYLEKEHPNLFPKQSLLEQAITYLGENDKEVLKLKQLEGIDELLAHQKLVVIIKWKNQGWIPNFDNGNEAKYFIWWYLGKDFRLYHVFYYLSSSTCSARLCFKNRSDAEEMTTNNEFINYGKQAFNYELQ